MLSGCVSGENEPSGLIDPCPTPEEGTKENTEYFHIELQRMRIQLHVSCFVSLILSSFDPNSSQVV